MDRIANAFTQAYQLKEQSEYQQTDSSTLIGGYSPLGPYYTQYGAFNAGVQTVNGASLPAAPILVLPGPTSIYPSGSIPFPTGANFSPTHATGNGYDSYFLGIGVASSVASLNAAIGSGTFTFNISGASLQPTLYLNVASPDFPATPMLISGGTWSGGALVLDPTVTNTLNFNTSSFTTYESGLGGVINYQLLNSSGVTIIPKLQSNYVPSLGDTDAPLSVDTIPAGSMVAGQTYVIQADYFQVEDVNTTAFTGTGIPGSPCGISSFLTSTFITVVAQASQTIAFPPIATQEYPGPTVALGATASSGLPVTYAVTSGPGTVSGSTLTVTGVGLVTVTASQAGNASYQSAPNQTQNITVTSASPQNFSQWETYYGIGGETATTTPENDGVPNQLKYLFNINPTTPMTAAERSALPTLGTTTVGGTQYLTLTYTEYMLETGITVNVQTSPDLQTWTTVNPPDFARQVGTDSNNDPIIEVGVVANGTNKQFIRLNVTQP